MTSGPVAVTVIGNDRIGIVNSVTRVLFELGCNLEDVTSTILRGHFSMTLIVRPQEDVGAGEIERALQPVMDELGLVGTARPVEEVASDITAPTHVISVYGSDHPGIVYEVADVLAGLAANITDLTSRVIGPVDDPVYALMIEAAVPDEHAVRSALEALRERLGVDVTVRPLEADVL